MKTIHQISIGGVKMLLLTGNIWKAYKVRRSLFCLDERYNPAIFQFKTRACLLRFPL